MTEGGEHGGGGEAADDIEHLRDAVRSTARRTAQLIAGVTDPDRRIPGSDWTVGNTAVHLAVGLETYAGYLEGSTAPMADLSDIPGGSLAASNAAMLGHASDRDLPVLGRRLEGAAEEVLRATEGRTASDRVFWHGRTEPLSTFLASALAELLVHGHDIARAVDEPWPIGASDARRVVLGLVPVLHLIVDSEAAAGVAVVYDVTLRGGGRFTLAFQDGRLDAELGPADAPTCRISADPVAFLLVAYGRRSQWRALARGQLAAWGRRPWWGLRLKGLLAAP